MGFFISFSIMAFTLLMFFSPSDNVIIHGKYDVGFREMVLEAKAGSVPLKVSMFYPIDRQVRTFKDSIASRFTNDKKPLWAPDGEHTVKGLMDSSSFYSWIFQPLQFARIDVEKDETLSKDFRDGAQKLPCMVVSHGAKAHRNFLSGFAREMASQGALVLCPEHTDESGACFFDEKNMRMETYMSKRHSETDVELWRRRLQSRNEDVALLLAQIHGKGGALLGAGELLDKEKVVLCGHGFGACSALDIARREEARVTHVVALDPWLLALKDEVAHGTVKLQQAVCIVASEEYHAQVEGFNSWATVRKVFDDSAAEDDMLALVKKTGHYFQTDLLSLAPNEFKMFSEENPSTEAHEMYELGNKIVVQFLKQTGFEEFYVFKHSAINALYEESLVKFF